MLKQRIITALILIVLVLAALFYLPVPLLNALIVGVMMLASFEWSTLVGIKTLHNKLIMLLLTCGVLWLSYYQMWPSLLIASLWWVLIFGKLSAFGRVKSYLQGRTLILALLSIPVLVSFALGLIAIRTQPYGEWQIMYCFALVFAADTGGYFVGSRFGSIKIAPSISPKKSLQGLGGSCLFALIVALFTATVAKISMAHWLFWYGSVLIIVLFALSGDLFESMIKRIVGVKDSGTLLPGHGGILDRIDSLTAAVPLYALLSLSYAERLLS